MSSQALYLKWRPQRFDDVVGQAHITQTLKNALSVGSIRHAYLFTGPRGTGKTTMARLLAKAVNCLDDEVSNRPCNRCHICTAINEGRLLDLIEMDAASNTGVDNVREAIRDKVGFRPNEARFKVYVIDEVHMLSTSAFNALLKTLEEPPAHVIFILATTEPHKILPTIISRCQRFDFKRIPLAALVGRLRYIAEQEGVQVEEQALRFIARMSTGCARDAIGLLDQLTAYSGRGASAQLITAERVSEVLGLGSAELVHELAAHLAGRLVGSGLDVIHRAVEQGADMRQFAHQIIEYLRALLLLHVGDESAVQDVDAQTQADMQSLAQQLSTHDLVKAIKLFNQAQFDLRNSDQNQIALELAFVEATLAEEPPPVRQTLPVGQAPQPTSTQPATLPAAPGRRPAAPAKTSRPQPSAGQERPAQSAAPAAAGSSPATATVVTWGELDHHWAEIRRAIRAQSKQAEALLNSATRQGIENGNHILFVLPSQLLVEKLTRPETRQIIEQAISSALGKPCRIEAATGAATEQPQTVAEASAPFDPGPAAPPGQTTPPAETPDKPASRIDIKEQAQADPVVQELLKMGGQIKAVQER